MSKESSVDPKKSEIEDEQEKTEQARGEPRIQDTEANN
jgi:hypothetical protein